jgi:hypothetical protein
METAAQQRDHEPIAPAGALVRQIGLLWTSRRPLLFAVAVLGVVALSGPPFRSLPGNGEIARLLPVWGFLLVTGPIWAFAVFHNEGPSSRLYHWSQPVSRTAHSLARVTAGAVWLVVVYALLLLAGFLFAMIDGNVWQLTGLPAGAWVNFFVGPLLGYLAVSILTIVSDYPIRWFFGIVFLLPLVVGLGLNAVGLTGLLETLAQPLVNERWGFAFAVAAEFVYGSAAVLGETGLPQRVVWWPVAAAWTVLLTALVAFTASLHPDRLPRLRGSR